MIATPDIGDFRGIDASALVDTGATTSGITRVLAEELGLRIVGKRPMASAHSDEQVERYVFRIGLFADRSEPDDAPQMPFILEAIEGFQIRPGFRFNAILGMDILSQCDLIIDRQRRCTLTFGRP